MLFSKEGRSLLTLPKHKSDASAQRRVVNGNKECYRIAEVRVMMEVIVACERECSLNEKKIIICGSRSATWMIFVMLNDGQCLRSIDD